MSQPFKHEDLGDGKHRISYLCECGSCGGTGLYNGMGERDGIMVVCHSCKGSGKRTLTVKWDEFHGRVGRDDVNWVLQANPGICCGTEFKSGDKRKFNYADWGGISHDDWRALGDPHNFPPETEMRDWTCPKWWYQSINTGKNPNWDECEWGIFSRCKHFPNKVACWARWDREHGA